MKICQNDEKERLTGIGDGDLNFNTQILLLFGLGETLVGEKAD